MCKNLHLVKYFILLLIKAVINMIFVDLEFLKRIYI